MAANLGYDQIVARRQALSLPGYRSYAAVGLDGPWITPYHIAARSPTGPVLLTYNYLDAPTASQHRDTLLRHGFLATMPFNAVLDLALASAALTRSDIYVTHAFHLLTPMRSSVIDAKALDLSFDAVARHELMGRDVIALGAVAARLCVRHAIAHRALPHPSARGRSFADRANVLAEALRANPAPSCHTAFIHPS